MYETPSPTKSQISLDSPYLKKKKREKRGEEKEKHQPRFVENAEHRRVTSVIYRADKGRIKTQR